MMAAVFVWLANGALPENRYGNRGHRTLQLARLSTPESVVVSAVAVAVDCAAPMDSLTTGENS